MEAVRAIFITYASLQSAAAVGIVGRAGYLMYNKIKESEDMESRKETILRLSRMMIIHMGMIYSNVFLHIFDFLTDVLVISRWFTHDAEHIDGIMMAWLAISFLILYRIISTFAVYATAKAKDETPNYKEMILQFIDLLFLWDLYYSHEQLMITFHTQMDVASASQSAIEVVIDRSIDPANKLSDEFRSTLRFRFIRSLQGLYEASVQSVFQIVYIMRAGEVDYALFIISIIFSVMSSIYAATEQDNVYIAESEWIIQSKDWKDLLSHQIRRFFFRFLEIISRIGTLSIFYTVVGGNWFILLIGLELSVPIYYNFQQYLLHDDFFRHRKFFMSFNSIIALPIEWTFEAANITDPYDDVFQKYCVCCECSLQCCVLTWPILAFFMLFQGIRWGICHPLLDIHYFKYASLRLFGTYIEWLIIILNYTWWEDVKTEYLVSAQHCLSMLIVTIIFLLLFTFIYPYLMIDLRLPNNIPVNSKLAYAYLGKIEELSKLYIENLNVIRFCDDYFIKKLHDIDRQSGGSNYYNHESVRKKVKAERDATEDAKELLTKVLANYNYRNDIPVKQRIENPLKELQADSDTQLVEDPIARQALDDIIEDLPDTLAKYWAKCISYARKNKKNENRQQVVTWLVERGAKT